MIKYGKEWQIPIFSDDEGKRRWKKIRGMMTLRGIECLVIAGTMNNYKAGYDNIRYVCQHINWMDDEYIVFPLEGEPSLHVNRGHGPWARKVSWIKEIVNCQPTATGLGLGYVQDIVKKIKSLGLEKATIGMVSERTMFADVYNGLQRELPQARFVEAFDILRACRIVKSPEELEFVRKGGEAADEAIKAMAKAARPGVNLYELTAEFEAAIIRAGCETGSFTPLVVTQWPNFDGRPTGGRNYTLRKGDIITNEVTPCFGGYFGHISRVISLGKPPAELMEWFEITKEAYQLAHDRCREGNYVSDIMDELQKLVSSKGPFNISSSTFQLMDSISIMPLVTGEIKSGWVIMIHPSLGLNAAAVKAKKRGGGITIGDVHIVTKGAAESVSKLPLDVIVV